MIATILDTVTGKTGVGSSCNSWWYRAGNGSCDCNRNPWDIDTGKPVEYCDGKERFLIIAAEFEEGDEEYTLDELNDCYPQELKDRHLTIQT